VGRNNEKGKGKNRRKKIEGRKVKEKCPPVVEASYTSSLRPHTLVA
jgi:hypothetical protein